MALRIALFGSTGKFGKSIAAAALADARFEIISALSHDRSSALGTDLGVLLHQKPLGILVSKRLDAQADLLIDASLADGLAERLALAMEKNLPLVLGATGLSGSDFGRIEKASLKIPLFYAPNFSIGMAAMRKLAAAASRYFPLCDVDLIEAHHTQKKDAPSGAAKDLAKIVEGNRPNQRVAIHSIRSGKIVGDHTLLFNTHEERLSIRHEAHSRKAFARGALAAASFLAKQKPGLYGMDDLLE
jgi:4-hydroxy-tetrahydrodipicolinate reductase